MTPYAGNADNYASTFDIPSDTDPPAAATFNVAYEALGDRTAALAAGYMPNALANIAALQAINTTSLANGTTRYVTGIGRYVLDTTVNPTFPQTLPLVVQPTTGSGRWFAATDSKAAEQFEQTFTTTGANSFQVPPNLSKLQFEAWGGGGGGGSGADGDNTTTDVAPGGSGGGAGKRKTGVIDVIPTHTLTITVGAAGAGGAGHSAAASDGSASSIADGASVLANAPGGKAGGVSVAINTAMIIPGGIVDGAGCPGSAPYQFSTQLPPPNPQR